MKTEAMKKFQEKVNWAEYCHEARKRRAEKLKEQGVLNPWNVISGGAKPKTREIITLRKEGRITIPIRVREKLNIDEGTELVVTVEDNKIIMIENK